MKFSRMVRHLLPIVWFGAYLGGATAQTPGNQPSADALRAACSDDVARLCAGVQSGGGRIIACLKQHQDELSAPCRKAGGLPPKASDQPLQPALKSEPDAALVPSFDTPGANSPAIAGPIIGEPSNVAGEKFVRHAISDTEHGNLTVATIRVPEKWTVDDKLQWHYDWIENPLMFTLRAANPGNSEAYFLYPLQRLESIEVAQQYRQYSQRGKQTPVGERMPMGAINMPLQPPLQAMAMFIKKVRPNATNLKWIGQQQDLPGLAQAMKLSPWPNDHGVAIKVGYDLDGQPVEEAFFGVYYYSSGTTGGMIKQTNWGFRDLQSFRAPAGTLDKRMPVFCLIAKSLTLNPQWLQLSKSITDQMQAAFDQKMKQGWDQIRAAQATMAQVQAQIKAADANFAKQDAALRGPGFDDSWLRTTGGSSGGGGTRSNSAGADDLIRQQEHAIDPTTGQDVAVSNSGSNHFTDGFGHYITSADPNYTPEANGVNGSWTRMNNIP